MISPYPIAAAVEHFPGVRQFQLVQSATAEYALKINATESEQLTQGLMTNLTGVLGKGAHIDIEYVDEIPVLVSGKRKYIVNEMMKIDQKQ